MSSRRPSVSSTGGDKPAQKDLSGNPIPAVPKKFLNGWTPEQERLMGSWADVAGCYRWLHDKSEKKYTKNNMLITIPVIILSTLTGTANFALSSFIPPDDLAGKNYASAAIGAVSIFAGILTTLGNFLRFAQGSEAHRVSSVAWGKFQRQITVEISIHPDDRMDCMDFLNICRQDLDRLIEQSPPIPEDIIALFEQEFKDVPNLKRPDICHGLEHTVPFNSNKPRLLKMTADATIYLKQRKKLLRDDIFPDIKERISSNVKEELDMALQKKWDDFERRHVVEQVAPISEPEPPAASFNFSGNWRRLIGITNAEVAGTNNPNSPIGAQAPNNRGYTCHDDIVEADEEAILNDVTMNEMITSTSSADLVISMKVNDVITPKPDDAEERPVGLPGHISPSPVALLPPPASHTTSFD
jgi:hypothetical protein